MNATVLRKKARDELASGTARKLNEAERHTLDLLQAPFRFVFWLIEQRKAWLRDQIDNESGER
jgi:hypothetical protein